MDDFTTVKLEISAPEEALDDLRAALHAAGVGRIGHYDHCLTVTPGRGYWRPLEGASPAQGHIGEVYDEHMWKIETRCDRSQVAGALAAIRRAHPFEEPVVNIIPLANHLF